MYLGLQVGRGIAALLVVLLHSSFGGDIFYGGSAFDGFWEFGSIGVDFFFVLSGFIIYWVHANDNNGISSASLYIKKRLIRIYPPFIPISITLLIVYLSFPSLSVADREIGVITSLFLMPTPPLHSALAVSWTLMHEMLFYTLFLLLYFNRVFLHGFFFIWSILIITLNILWNENSFVLTFFLNPHNLQFLFGVVAAMLVMKKKHNQMYTSIGFLMLFSYIAGHQYGITSYFDGLALKIYLGFCFMFIVIGLCAMDKSIQYPKFLLFLGAASYSIYLIHYPIVSILNRAAQEIHKFVPLFPEILFMFIVSFSLLSGVIYYLIWEKPSLRFLKKHIF